MLILQPSAASSRRQIIVQITVNYGTMLYTVPPGKTFTGHLTSTSTSYPAYIYADGVQLAAPPGGIVPLTLVAGTVVTGYGTSNNGGTLVGIEE